MSKERQVVKLGDLGRVVTGKTPSTKVPENFGEDVPFVTPSDMDGRKTISVTERYLSTSGVETVKSAMLPAGAVIVSCIGSDMGKAAIAGKECVTNQQVNSIIVSDKWCAEYVYYDLSTRKAELQNLASGGSAQPILNKGHFSQVSIVMPPLDEQRAIASTLGSLDDKIELNRRMNETLEETARALFKSWFVNFDPVRAKLEGRQPAGMDEETAALFPDSFEDSALGEIPKGWTVESIYSVSNVIYGSPFSSKLFNEEGNGLPLLRIRDLATHNPKIYTPEEHPRGTKVAAGDIVVGMDGEFRAHIWTGPDAYLNQRVCMFVPKEGVPAYFLKESLRELLAFFERAKTGTTVIHLGKRDIDTFTITIPGGNVMGAFENLARPITQRMISNVKESRTLAAIRDALLPKLLSGEVRVREAEEVVEETLWAP